MMKRAAFCGSKAMSNPAMKSSCWRRQWTPMTSRRNLLLGLLACLLAGPAAAQDVPRDAPEALLRFIYGHYVGKPAGADIDFEWMSSPMVDALFTAEVAKAVLKETDSEELGGL